MHGTSEYFGHFPHGIRVWWALVFPHLNGHFTILQKSAPCPTNSGGYVATEHTVCYIRHTNKGLPI